jgi:hypothetical protein
MFVLRLEERADLVVGGRLQCWVYASGKRCAGNFRGAVGRNRGGGVDRGLGGVVGVLVGLMLGLLVGQRVGIKVGVKQYHELGKSLTSS